MSMDVGLAHLSKGQEGLSEKVTLDTGITKGIIEGAGVMALKPLEGVS